MWKKILIVFTLFIAAASVSHSFFNQRMSAASTAYRAGGNISGRIVTAPTNINKSSGIVYGFRQYDVLEFNTMNNHVSKPLAFKLIEKESYRDYATVSCTPTDTLRCNNTTITAWYALSNDPIDYLSMGLDTSDFIRHIVGGTNPAGYAPYSKTAAYTSMKALNNQIDANTKDQSYLTSRNLTHFHDVLDSFRSLDDSFVRYGLPAYKQILSNDSKEEWLGNHVYTPSGGYFSGLCSTIDKGYGFGSVYWSSYNLYDNPGKWDYYNWSFSASGDSYWEDYNGWEGNSSLASSGIKHDLRAAAYISQNKLNQVVFAVSSGNTNGKGKITENSNAVLQPRTYNNSLTVSLSKLSSDTNGTPLTNNRVAKDQTIYLNGTGTSGSTVVSILVFDRSGNFLYYEPLDSASNFNTKGYVAFDTSGLAVGSYQLALVNEEYDENIPGEMNSSLLSNVQTLEIVNPLTISAAASTDLEVGKNVNQNDVVATYTTSNGVAPITTTLVSDISVSGHENDYQLFSISNGNVIVKGSNGLNAGDYYFKINAKDSNGDPVNGVNSATVHVVVGKTNLTVAFDDANITKKSIDEAKTSWNETATANPSAGTEVTYSVSGGDISLITINPNTGAITYAGNNAYGKVKIKATADDDPSSGKDNYNPAFSEKEIIIYRGVDGSVTPDSNSSSTQTPTFTTADSNIKVNGIIGTIRGSAGTPDTIGGNTTTYMYGLKTGVGDAGFFSVDANTGVIKTTANLGVKTYSITVTVSDKWSTKEIPVTINVGMSAAENLRFYENSTSSTIINSKSAKVTDTNVTVFATVKGSTNMNPVTYKIKDGSTNIIEVNPNSGAVTIHGVGTVTIVAEKQGASGQADARTELTFTVTAGAQNFIYTDSAGNELPKSGSNYSAKTETYEPNKSFQLYTAGNPTGSTVSYQLKAGSPSDVISVDSSGLVTILNASLNNQMGRVIVQATSRDPSGNYADKTIELPINIEKGTRTISFKENPIYAVSGNGSVTPVIEVDGVIDTDGDVLIEVDHNEDSSIAWTSDNKTIEYDYSEPNPKDIKIHATKPMDRNYKAAEADGILHIMGPNENVLAITSPGKITYGDHFTIRSSQYDADSTNVQYKFEIDDTTYISSPTVNGNSAAFDAKQFSGSNKTTITVTRTADGESPLSKKVQVSVLPKPIEIVIDDKEKLKGEQNPSLTYQDFKNKLVSWNGVQDVIQENDIKLSTTAKTNSNAGSYPIKGDANSLNKTYPNYSFSFKQGTLTIKEEAIEDDWYHLEVDDENNTAYTGDWTNQNVNIISDHNEYINLSLDGNSWNPSQVTITSEGETNQSFWMKKDSGAITKEKQETIRIDKTAPKVKNIKAKDTNNKLQDIINKISGGIFFKPGTSFEVTTSDAKDDLKVSGTKEIAYKVYKTEKQSRAGDELIKDGTLTVTKEKASITISELTGSYKVCVIPTDNAGNTNIESCHEVALKKIDVDVDGDGKPDFNDPDGDGCPDLNIKWKDPENPDRWIVVNGDRNYDGLPDLNIDSDGDGIPDLNVDTDGDGKPDLNLVILKKDEWKPTKCVKADPDNGILEEYCTGTNVKPVINVDTDNDGIPNINIDNKGDFKPHINISKDGKTSIINIAIIHEWKPELNKALNSFQFDTMAIDEKKNVLLNIDTDGDGRPDVNIDLDGDGKPDVNVDTDFDWIPNINIDSDGDGQPDTNIDTDNDGIADENIVEIKEWKPNKNVDGDLPYDTMDFNEQDPSDDTTTDPIPPKNDTSVKGVYNPATSMGGAMTGDSTNVMLYITSIAFAVGLIAYLIYKKQKDTFQ